jgi:hypothetical protein
LISGSARSGLSGTPGIICIRRLIVGMSCGGRRRFSGRRYLDRGMCFRSWGGT